MGLRALGLLVAAVVSCALVSPALAGRAPMAFRVAKMLAPECGSHCPDIVIADGVIETDTATNFIAFAKSASVNSNLHSVVLLNSPGGNVAAALELGEAFRRLHVAAIVAAYAASDGVAGPVAGQCASACVYALMGAVKRIAPPMSQVELHKMRTAPSLFGQRQFADDRLVAMVARYARRMGVHPEVVFTAESLPADSVRVLSRSDLARWKLATSAF